MLFWIDNGYKLQQINGNSGVYVASRGGKHGVLSTNQFDELERRSAWFTSEAEARAEAEFLIGGLALV